VALGRYFISSTAQQDEICGNNKTIYHTNGASLYDRHAKPKGEHKEIEALQRKIGQLTMELDFLKKHSGNERGSKASSHFPDI